MDHFPLPKGKAHIQVPNLTFEHYTRGNGNFDSYPARKGWNLEDLTGRNSFGRRPPAEVQSFFQSWLYFGCTIEVLAVSGVETQQSDLLDETGRFVSARRLPFLIRRWRQKARQIGGKSSRIHIEWAMKTALILKRVSDFVDLYCLPYYGSRAAAKMQESGDARSPLSELTWMSIIALGHTLTEAMISYYDIRRTGNHWGASPLLKRRLLQRGWCPMDIERSMTDIGIDGHYYLARMARTEANISHEACTENECKARDVDKMSYQQRHVRESGDCGGNVTADIPSVVKIINTGNLPVFKWDPTRKQLEVKSSRLVRRGISDPPFVAISHVWSDGMGNLEENSLLECQLDRVQGFVHAIAQSARLGGRPQHFWLDTLCVPVGKSMEMRAIRKISIAKMADTYKAASAVLVLSSTIQAVATTDSEKEKGLALYLANWNRRLWTCQEGMLAKTILLQFSDKAVSNDDIEYPGVGESIARGHCITFPGRAHSAAMSEFVILRDFLRDGLFAEMGPVTARVGPLAPMISVIQTRSTSYRSDETICFGALIGLNLGRLQSLDREIREEYRQKDPPLRDDEPVPDGELARRRMKLFLSMVKVFPRDIIFNSHERLDEEGFRWAPASFLGIPRRGFVRHVEGEPAILDKNSRGLSVRAAGFVITVDVDSPMNSSSPLLVRVPRGAQESLELKITIIQPSRHSPRFSWKPAMEYGVIVDRSIAELSRDFSKYWRQDVIPETPPELESWFERLFSKSGGSGTVTDAVIGYVRGQPVGDGNNMEKIQVQHICVANVTLLNPPSISQDDEGSDSDWESEQDSPEQDGPEQDESEQEEPEQDESREPQSSLSGASDNSVDSGYLDLIATGDFVADGLDNSEDSDSSESAEASPDLPGLTDSPNAYPIEDFESDSEAIAGTDISQELDQLSDWGSVIGEGDRPGRDHGIKESDEQVKIRGVGTYIEHGKWFIV